MAGEKIDQIQSIDKLKEKTIGVFSKLAADYDKHIKNDFSLTNIGNEKNGLIQAAVTMAIQAINDNEIDKANQIIIQLERRIREIHNESPNRAGKYEDSQSYQLIEKLKTEFGDYTTQLDAEISRIRLKQEVLHRLLTSVEDWAVPAASKIEPEKLTTKGEIVKDLEKVERILSGINQAIVSNAKALELNIPGISSEVIEEAKGASLNISQKKQALEARLLKIQEDAINKIKIAQLEINRHLTELSSKLEGLNPTQSDSAEDIVKKLQLLQELETKVNIVDQQSSEKKVELDKTADDAGLNDEQKFRLHSLEAVKLDVVSTKDNLNLRIESLKKSAVDKLNSSVREITQDKIKELKTEAAVKEIQDKVRGLQSAVTKALEAAESANKQMANTGVTDVAPIDVQSAKTELEAAAKKQEELKARLTVIQEARAAVSEAQPKLTAAVAALNAQLAIDPKKLLDAGAIEAAQKEIERLKDAVETVVVAAAEANDKATAAGVVGVAVGAANEALGAIVAKEQELNNRMATIQREAKELIDTAQLDLNTKMENLIAKTDSLFQTSTDTAAIIENNLSTLAELEKSFNTIKQEAKAKKTQLDKIAQDAGIENTFTLVPLKMENGNNTKIETTKLLLTIELATKKVAEAQEKLATAVDALNTKLKTDPKTLNAPKAVQEVKQEIERLKGEVEAAVKEATAANVKANDVGVDGVNMTTANQALESITLINQALSKREKDILDIQKLVDEASKKLQHANSEYGQYNLKLVSFNADAFEGNKSSSDIIKEQIVLESFKQKIEQLMEEAKLVNTKAGDKEVLYTVFMRGAESSLLSIKDREKVLQSELEKAQATEALAAAQGRLDEAVAALNEGLGAIKPAALKDAAGVKAAQKRISDLQQTYENSLKQSGIDTANDLAKAAGVKEVNIEIAKSVPEKISLGLKALDTALQIMQNTANSSKTSLEEALASLNTKIAEINPNELKTVKSANDKIAELRSEKETLKTLLDNYTEKAQAADITDQKLISRAEEVITKNNKQGHLDKRSKQITKAESELKSAQEELSTCQEKLNTAPDQIKPEELTTASEVETQISRLGGLKTKLDDAQKKAEAANTNAVTTNIDARIDTTIDTTKYGPAIEKLNERLGLIQQTTKSVQETQQKLEQAVKELDLAIQIDPKTLSSPGSVQARQQNIAQLTQELNTAKEAAVTAKTSAEQNNINTQTYAEVLVNSQKTLDDSVQQILVQATAKQQDLDSRQEVIGSLLAKIGEAHQQFKLKTKYLNDSLERTPSQTFTSVDAINKKTQDLQELLQGVREAQNSTQQLLVTAKNSNIEANVSTDTAQIEAKVAAQIKELALKYGTMQAEARQAIALANKDLKSKAQQLATEVQAIPTELDSVAKIKLNIGELDKAKKRTSEFNQNANLSATTLDQQARNAGITDKITIPDTLTLSQDIQSKISELETKAENIIQQATQAKQTLDKAVGALNQIPVENLSNLQQIKQGKTKLATANQALKDYTEKAELADSPVNTTDISTTIQKFDGALNTKSEQITQAAADAKQTLEAAVQDINTNIGTITPGTLKINDVETKTGELEGARKQLQELLSDYTQKAQAAEVDPKAQAEAANITLRAISSTQANILAQQSSLALSAYGAQRSLDKAIEELKQIAGQPVEGLKVDGLVQRITKITQAQQQVAVSVKKCEAVSESTGIPIDTSKANPSEADTIKQSIQGRIETIKEAARQKVSAHQDTLDRLATPLGQPNEPFTTAQEIKDEQDRLEKLIAETKTAIATADQINIEARYAKIDGVKTQPATEALDAAQTKLQDLTAQSEQITKAAVEAQDKLNEALASLNDKIAEINPNELNDLATMKKFQTELSECKTNLTSAQVEFKSKADATKISGTMDLSLSSSMFSAFNAQEKANKTLEALTQRITTINEATSAIRSAQDNLNQEIQLKLDSIPEPDTIRSLTNVTEIQSQLDKVESLKKDIIALEDKAKLTNEQLNEKASGAGIQNTFDMTSFETIRGKIEKSSTMLNDKKGAFIVQALTAVKDLDKKVADINQEIEKLPNPITESNQIILAIEQLKSLKSDVEQQFKQFEQLTIPALGDESTKQKIDTSIASYSSAIANLEQTIQSLEQKELDIQAKASASLKTLNSKITDSQELIAKIENLSDPKHAKIDKLTLENYLKDLQELSRELPKMLSSAEKDAKNANQPSLDDQAKMVADFRSKISNYETIINQKLEILRLSAQPSQAFQQQNPTRINPLNSNTQSIVNSAEPISQSPFKGFNIFSRYKEQLDTQKEQNTPLASINFQERVDLKELELFKKEGGVTLTVPTTNHTFQFRHDGKHDAQAILTREGAGIGKEPIAELSDEQRQNIGLDVINMIENVLAKGNNLHFKTSDPYVAEFAKQYVEDLKTKGLKINDSIEGPKTEQPANANAAQKAREDLDIIKSKFSYENDFSNRPWVKEHKESEKKIQEKAPRPPASNP
jgi:DNA repair exonuclease SbcCD ATPase subunit